MTERYRSQETKMDLDKVSQTSIRSSNEHPRHSFIRPSTELQRHSSIRPSTEHHRNSSIRPSTEHSYILPPDSPAMCPEFLRKDHGMNFITKLPFYVLLPHLSLNNYFQRLDKQLSKGLVMLWRKNPNPYAIERSFSLIRCCAEDNHEILSLYLEGLQHKQMYLNRKYLMWLKLMGNYNSVSQLLNKNTELKQNNLIPELNPLNQCREEKNRLRGTPL